MTSLLIPYDTGLTRMEYARYLNKAGRTGEAKAKYNSAVQSFKEAGTEIWAERAKKELDAI